MSWDKLVLNRDRWLTGETGPFHSHGVVYAITEEENKAGTFKTVVLLSGFCYENFLCISHL